MKIGFIGLGNMGQAMARNLCKAGHKVSVYNRTRSRAEELEADGAVVVDTPADACGGDVVITMLSDDRAVEDVVLGSGGFIGALAAGLASNAAARWLHRPAAVTLVPGIILLVPGSFGYRSVAALLADDVIGGIDIAFTMVIVAVALVAGLLSANVLLPPRQSL